MKTKSAARGKNTSSVEIGNVSAHGFWLIIKDRELFVPFAQFPWFKEASIGKLLNVKLPHPDHLYWPDLDIDLAVESIEHPERYPLVSKAGTDKVRESRRPRTKRPATKKGTRR
jgi:hypothetical protein